MWGAQGERASEAQVARGVWGMLPQKFFKFRSTGMPFQEANSGKVMIFKGNHTTPCLKLPKCSITSFGFWYSPLAHKAMVVSTREIFSHLPFWLCRIDRFSGSVELIAVFSPLQETMARTTSICESAKRTAATRGTRITAIRSAHNKQSKALKRKTRRKPEWNADHSQYCN